MLEWLKNQSGNRFLWVPLIMAMGSAAYFLMPTEPTVWFAPLWVAVAFLVAVTRRTPILIRAIAIGMFGFMYAAAYTNILATPVMSRGAMRDVKTTGRVVNIDYTASKARVYLRIPATDIGAGDGTAVVRASVATDGDLPTPGDYVSAKMGLYRPEPADAPGGFDYARWAYFNGLSATGYLSEYEIVSHATGGMDAIRNSAHKKLNSFLADALVFGFKNTLDADDRRVWMATGVGHIWSISGFHITLVATWLIVICMFIFRAIPYVTRRVPARIPATIVAWVGLTFYLFLSGAGIATIRAFLMASLMFLALMLGRTALSLRNVALAFCAIFLINPHFVLQAGFQLSFAAIFGLVWFWDRFRWMPSSRFLRVIYAAVMTSVVATVFTMPFVAMHFGEIPIYGVIGNLVLLPLFSFVVMPLTILGTMMGLVGWMTPLDWAQWSYDIIFRIANIIASLPHATVIVPHIPTMGICAFIIGGAALMFIRPTRLRENYVVFAVLTLIGVTVTATAPRPVVYSTADNELIAFRENGKLSFNKSSASNHYFTFDSWRTLNGEDTNAPRPRRRATNGVIDFETPDFRLVYIQKFVPLAANIVRLCASDGPDYIVSYFRVDAPNCHARILSGGFVIYEDGRVKFMNPRRRWHRNRN